MLLFDLLFTNSKHINMYQVIYKKAAIKGMRKMPIGFKIKMAATLKLIAEDPKAYQGDWRLLSGSLYWLVAVGQLSRYL